LHSQLAIKAKRGFRGYPFATIAFYGPDSRRATKVAVAIVPLARAQVTAIERWTVEDGDVRSDAGVNEAILEFLRRHAAKSVVMTAGVVGCPHEEGPDHADGAACPMCPYWAGRVRRAAERQRGVAS
jgi:hypothetical protein